MVSTVEKRFNLVDEPWIPVVNYGLVSLRQIFSDYSLRALGGNPIQKISLLKFLLAIEQTAFTPDNDDTWRTIGAEGMAQKAITYLDDKKDLFWLYGDRPFLQIPLIEKAFAQNSGALIPSIATGNTSILTQSQIERQLTDAENALLVLVIQGFALGGKKTDNSIVLSAGYSAKSNDKGKPSTGKSGPALGFLGYLHSFLMGKNIIETCWLNLLSKENVDNLGTFMNGLGTPVWEQMPDGENCEKANYLKNTYIGRLVPLNRFIYVNGEKIHYSEGIVYPTHKEGGFDLSTAVDYSRDPKAMWVDPEKKPWRQLVALLSFINSEKSGFNCPQLRLCLMRAKEAIEQIGIWSGGIKVSSNAGEQYLTGLDDFLESETIINTSFLGDIWFSQLKTEMTLLDEIVVELYNAVNRYFKRLKADKKFSSGQASNGKAIFWQQAESRFSELIISCDDKTGESCRKMHTTFASMIQNAFNELCPKDTARQLEAWAASRPNLSKYLTVNNN